MISIRETLILIKKIFPFFLLFTVKTVNCQLYAHNKIIAYYTGNGKIINEYPVNKLTHIIYSFLHLQNDTLSFRNQEQRLIVEELVVLKKKNPQLKIMVSIGGWGGCAPCSELFSNETHRAIFAKTTVALFEKYGIDGLDLDWEYPAIEGYPGHQFNNADKNNFTELIKALRKEMGAKYLLTFAAGGFINYLEKSIDWTNVMPLVDFVNLMTYDLVGGYSTLTGHHTPLSSYRSGQESTQKCVNWLLKNNVAADKLIIGAAFYARVWEQVADTNHGLYQSGKFKQGVAFKNFSTYFTDSSGYRYYWDKKAKAPYQYSASQKLFATFDDERSIKEKTKFIRRNKLGGIMFWELSQDKNKDGLVDLLYNRLN